MFYRTIWITYCSYISIFRYGNVKKDKHIIKKCLALIVVVLYFFMASTYISWLPKYNSNWPKTSTIINATYLHKNNNANNRFIQIHLAFKTVVENKLKALNILIKTAAFVFLVVFSEAAIPVLLRKSGASLKTLLYTHRSYYLTLCTLRIWFYTLKCVY